MTPELQRVCQAFANQYSIEFDLTHDRGVALSPVTHFAPLGEFEKAKSLKDTSMSDETNQEVAQDATSEVATETTEATESTETTETTTEAASEASSTEVA